LLFVVSSFYSASAKRLRDAEYLLLYLDARLVVVRAGERARVGEGSVACFQQHPLKCKQRDEDNGIFLITCVTNEGVNEYYSE
jgi:hypothetical protein